MPKVKFFAVAVGREGRKIYDNWTECEKNVTRYPGAKHKSFPTRREAQEWLDAQARRGSIPRRGPPVGAEVIVIDSEDSDSATSARKLPIKPSAPKRTSPVRYGYDSDDTDMEIEIISPPQSGVAKTEPPSTKDSTEIILSPEQKDVLRRVSSGQNVFFTGSAGTGKSILLNEIIKTLKNSGKITAVTASTGIASVNIKGTTLHSWAGIQLGGEDVKKYVGKFLGRPNSPATKRWRETHALIIDEVSMIDGALFDKLEEIGRRIRHSDRPFGGIQLVLSGDFCQLPPVPGRQNGEVIPVTFAFDSKSWSTCVGSPVTLTRVFRQKDQRFVNMLNAMRFGVLDPQTVQAFRALARPLTYTDGIGPTEIYALRSEVDNANSSRLRNLPGEQHTYRARDIPGIDAYGNTTKPDVMEKLLDRLVVPREVSLKVGAQVMLLKNLEQGHLVNGSVGQVTDFVTAAEALDASLAIGAGPGVDDPSAAVRGLPPSQKWPLVQFLNGRRLVCIPQDFTVENVNGQTEAKRDQVPLILAWALSVHKSQGQTLERVKVDLRSTFEKGQAYVALSRATTMENLQVLNFDPTKVAAHPRVIEWAKGEISHEVDVDEDFFFD